MELQKRKKNKNYIIFRIYAPVIWVCVLIWGIFWLISAARDSEPNSVQLITFGILFPLFGIDIFMLMSIFVFPFEFSIFGHLERTHFPDEKPTLKKTGTWGAIGILFRATVPFFSWYVFPSGLGISILGMGKAFIPAENIKELKDIKGMGIFTGRYMLTHNSSELHGPVYLPDKQVFEALKVLLNL
jgi:hypothetical protein